MKSKGCNCHLLQDFFFFPLNFHFRYFSFSHRLVDLEFSIFYFFWDESVFGNLPSYSLPKKKLSVFFVKIYDKVQWWLDEQACEYIDINLKEKKKKNIQFYDVFLFKEGLMFYRRILKLLKIRFF